MQDGSISSALAMEILQSCANASKCSLQTDHRSVSWIGHRMACGELFVIGIWKQERDPVNSSPPNAAYMRQWIGSALVQIMACRLFGAKPLSKPTLGYCQLNPKEQTSVKFSPKYKISHSRKCIWIYRLRNGGHLVQEEMGQTIQW